jgi:hypothetical protein
MSAEERRGPLRIPTEKIVAYLLNLDHRKGGLKARFFLSFGFTREEPGVMAETRRRCLRPRTLERVIVEGEIVSPDGRNPRVRAVWQREEGEVVAWRLITVVPITTR